MSPLLRKLLLPFALTATLAASPHDFEVDGIYYNITSSSANTVAVTYRGSSYSSYSNEYSGSVVIPSSVEYNGKTYSVTAIGGSAFRDCSSLASVVIPNSVTSIGYCAFDGCRGLKKSAYPSSIGNPFGYGVTIAYPDDCHIDEAGVIYDKDITNVYYAPMTLSEGYRIPNTVTSIGDNAFHGCSSMTSVVIPNSVTSIGNGAFKNCSSLASVVIPNSVTSIGNSAFYYCSSLAAVVIPNSVTSIGNSAFAGCKSLASIEIPNSVTTIGGSAFSGCSSLASVEIPNSVTFIGNYAFAGCSSLTSVVIPNSVTSIGNDAFYGNRLKSVTFGSGLLSIGSSAFTSSNHRIAKAFWLGNTPPSGYGQVNAYVNYVSNDQYNLDYQIKYQFLSSKFTVDGTVYVPVSPSERTCDVVDCLYNPAYSTVVISDKVTNKGIEMTVNNIQRYAFYDNAHIESLTISNVGFIGSYAFYGCTALQTATIENKGDIGESAFYNDKGLNQVKLGNDVTGISKNAFYGCSAIPEITIPNSVNALGASALQGCSSLKSVILGTGFPSLPTKVFSGCTSLESISVPCNISSIGDYAFERCFSLKNLILNDFKYSINRKPKIQTFPDWESNPDASQYQYVKYECEAEVGDLLTFNYREGKTKYDQFMVTVNNHILLDENGGKSGSIEYLILESGALSIQFNFLRNASGARAYVTDICLTGTTSSGGLGIGSNANKSLFDDCPLDRIYLGRKIYYRTGSNYGYSPFYRNTSLRTVEITDAETEIYNNEFYGCSGLNSLKIGNGVKKIGNWAFSGCSSLDYFSAGYNVESIGAEAFSDCTGLTKYYSYSVVPPVCGNQALDDINKWECALYVPAESSDEYQAASQWKDFFFVEEMSAVLVAAIELNTSEAELIVGSTLQLSATILPANATNQALVWESSDVSVADVDNNGLVSGLKEGTTTITARSADGNAEATCVITVKGINGIDTVSTPAAYALVRTPNGYIVRNARGARVEVYSADGRMVYLAPTYAEEEIALPAGLYIVRAANRAWKVRF